jgi:hypothetical protein
VLLSRESALRFSPVTLPWFNRLLRELPATLERLRLDRQLDEAISSGADPLEVATVFGVANSTAVHYAHANRQLLELASSGTPRFTTIRWVRSRRTRPIEAWFR